MSGVFIDHANLQKHKVLIDSDGNQLESLDNKQVIKPATPLDVAPPANLAEILAIKEQRLKTIPEDELSQFDINTGKTTAPAEFVSPAPQPSRAGTPKDIQAEIVATETRLQELRVKKQEAIEKMKAELAELES
jgi:hypothetical protein